MKVMKSLVSNMLALGLAITPALSYANQTGAEQLNSLSEESAAISASMSARGQKILLLQNILKNGNFISPFTGKKLFFEGGGLMALGVMLIGISQQSYDVRSGTPEFQKAERIANEVLTIVNPGPDAITPVGRVSGGPYFLNMDAQYRQDVADKLVALSNQYSKEDLKIAAMHIVPVSGQWPGIQALRKVFAKYPESRLAKAIVRIENRAAITRAGAAGALLLGLGGFFGSIGQNAHRADLIDKLSPEQRVELNAALLDLKNSMDVRQGEEFRAKYASYQLLYVQLAAEQAKEAQQARIVESRIAALVR